MKTTSYMVRLDPKKLKELQDEAKKQDLTAPQLIRRILDKHLGYENSEKDSV